MRATFLAMSAINTNVILFIISPEDMVRYVTILGIRHIIGDSYFCQSFCCLMTQIHRGTHWQVKEQGNRWCHSGSMCIDQGIGIFIGNPWCATSFLCFFFWEINAQGNYAFSFILQDSPKQPFFTSTFIKQHDTLAPQYYWCGAKCILGPWLLRCLKIWWGRQSN